MSVIGYIRVSTVEQNSDRQKQSIGEVDELFEDKCSGGEINRPALNEMLRFMRKGDLIKVHSIDRLARNSKHLLEFIEQVKTQKVDILFIKENLHFKSQDNDFVSELILQIIGAVSQFELAMITERRKEGIANAKAKGKYKGRAKNTANEYQAHKLRAAGYSFQAIADEIGCARSTVQRYLANKIEIQADLDLAE